MADLRISSLPRKAALAINDIIPIVDLQFGSPNYVNKKTTIGDIITIVQTVVTPAVVSVNGQNGTVVLNLTHLDDVTIQTPVAGDVLLYNAATSAWVNGSISDFYAPLVAGTIPSQYLPSYVDDVIEYANLAAFPATGESGKIYVTVDTRRTYRWSGSGYVEISPNDVTSVNGQTGTVALQTDDIALDASITVMAVTQGGYSDGTTIPAGTALTTIIRNMLQIRVPATYTQPTLTIATSSAIEYEYGDTPTIAMALAWAKNDAGNATQFKYQTTGGTVLTTINATTPTNYSHTFSSPLTAVTSFNGTAAYGAGAQKPDNMGAFVDPPIAAGTKTSANTVTITPKHKMYWGISTSPNITDLEIWQTLPTSEPDAGSAFVTAATSSKARLLPDFNPAGQYIYIAYPAALGLAVIKFNGYVSTSAWVLTTRLFYNRYNIATQYNIYRTQYTQNSQDIDIEVQ
jgi:hypothetical protein